LFPYPTPESIWLEHRESTRGRDLDISGMSYRLLEEAPQQWPLREGETTGKVRLYEDGVFPTPDGRAKFVNTVYQAVAEPRESRYPFSLTTGRLRDQWHGMSRTGTLGSLFAHASEPCVQMHPQDMARRQLKEGDLVHVTSKRGSIMVPVQMSAEMGLSQVFMAMHWGEEFVSGVSATGERLAGVNALTTSAYCPDSKQPEFKHAAVKVLKADLPWTLLAVAWLPSDRVLAVRTQLQALMAHFSFASCVPFASTSTPNTGASPRTGVLFRAAHHESVAPAVLQRIETLMHIDGDNVVLYADPKRGQRRALRLLRNKGGKGGGNADTRLESFLLAGDTSAQTWLTALLQDEQAVQRYGRALLAASAKPPEAVSSRGKTVCTCFNVSDLAIQAQLQNCHGAPAEQLASLQNALKCGTNCGSCVPQLQRMVRSAITQTL
jgi:assimilatory nitrate reductase catalytic subunit